MGFAEELTEFLNFLDHFFFQNLVQLILFTVSLKHIGDIWKEINALLFGNFILQVNFLVLVKLYFVQLLHVEQHEFINIFDFYEIFQISQQIHW